MRLTADGIPDICLSCFDSMNGYLRSLHEWQQEGKLIDSHAQAVTLQVESRDEIAIIVKQLVDRGARVYRVDAVEKGLEDVFMNLMKA